MLFFVPPYVLDRLVVHAADAGAFVVGDPALQDTLENSGEKTQRSEPDRTILGLALRRALARALGGATGLSLWFACCTSHDIVYPLSRLFSTPLFLVCAFNLGAFYGLTE